MSQLWAPGICGASGATGYYFFLCHKAVSQASIVRETVFMFREKKITILFIALLAVLILASASFSYEVSDVSGSFVVRADFDSNNPGTHVVKMTARLKVEALTGPVADSVEHNLEKASSDIYKAKIKADEARRQQRSKAASSTNLSATPVNFTSLEAEIVNLINSTRQSHGLSTLSCNQMLTDMARSRSGDMVSRGYFSHFTPEGQNIKHMLSQYRVSYMNFGENLGNATPAGYGTPQAFLNAWMNSPSHRANMLKDYYTFIGVGIADGGGRRVVTVLFIR